MKKWVSAVGVTALMTVLTIGLFDAVAYFALPYRLAIQFPDYRAEANTNFGGRGHYPFNYFVTHAERGFDIGANKQASHTVDNLTYPIWSNSLGCFDREHTSFDNYLYLIGDSFTWGYAPLEDKFGTLLEDTAGKTTLKCGVTHTGQRHQFAKMLEISERTQSSPSALLLVWYYNDIANDYFFPHSTVVEGWQVDRVFIDTQGNRIEMSDAALTEGIQKQIARLERQNRPSLGKTVRRYSITANLLKSATTAFRATTNGGPKRIPERRSIYQIDTGTEGYVKYKNNPFAEPNKQALQEIQAYAQAQNAPLRVILVPPREHVQDTQYHAEVREFLAAKQFQFLDLAEYYAEHTIEADEVFWLDGHFNIRGNQLLADLVKERFPELLK